MPYASNKDLPDSIKGKVPSDKGQSLMREVINSQLDSGKSESVAFASAWSALQNAGYKQDDEGLWKVLTTSDVHVPTADEKSLFKIFCDWLKSEEKPERDNDDLILDEYISKANDIEKAEYEGREVELNKPFRTPNESKKFAVYVRNDKGNVVIVRFGDPDMEIRRDDPDARRNFRARHNCDTATDKTSARYWSCRMWSSANVSDLTKNEPSGNSGEFTIDADIIKSDDEMRVVYGWASIIEENGEPVTDHQGDIIAEDDLVKAAHEYIREYRAAKAMHEGDQIGEIVESMVITSDIQKALGIDINKVGWFIGMKIHDDGVWKSFKDGKFKMFSIGGQGRRIKIEDQE